MTGSVTINEVTVTLRALQHAIATAAPPPVTGICPRNNAISCGWLRSRANLSLLARGTTS